jgi:uncharacterized protein YbaA (DUF1428 family)
MAKYVDGFVIAMPSKNLDLYKKMAKLGAKTWMKHGALDYKECVIEDAAPDMASMGMTTFSKLAKAKPDETVLFAYIVFKSRSHRDQVNKKVMKEFEANDLMKEMPMPFKMHRMSYGGFDVLVEG